MENFKNEKKDTEERAKFTRRGIVYIDQPKRSVNKEERGPILIKKVIPIFVN